MDSLFASLLVDEIEAAALFREAAKTADLQNLINAANLLSKATERRAWAEWQAPADKWNSHRRAR